MKKTRSRKSRDTVPLRTGKLFMQILLNGDRDISCVLIQLNFFVTIFSDIFRWILEAWICNFDPDQLNVIV